jgi:hypothetical protein
MPRIIVLTGHGKGTVFELYSETLVGSTEECDLVLDHDSVSRRHARLTIEGDNLRVEDLESSNGVRINGESVQSADVPPGTEVGVGRYTLVPVSDTETFYQGRFISYLPVHGATGRAEHMPTTGLAPGELEKMERRRQLINGGKLVLDSHESQFWLPGAHKLTFGKNAMVAISGMFTGGIAAEVAWDGDAHVLRKLSTFATVKVNGAKVSESKLSDGDVLSLGKSIMHYRIEE